MNPIHLHSFVILILFMIRDLKRAESPRPPPQNRVGVKRLDRNSVKAKHTAVSIFSTRHNAQWQCAICFMAAELRQHELQCRAVGG